MSMKKKWLWILALGAIVVLALGTMAFTFYNPFQNQGGPGDSPDGYPDTCVEGCPYGTDLSDGAMMGGRGGRGGHHMNSGDQPYLLDETMHQVLADSLGITLEDLETRMAEGQTLIDIGIELGFTTEQLTEIMQDARTAAIEALVSDGTITREQADWMLERMGGSFGGGMAGGRRGGGMMGGGFNATGDCPYMDTVPDTN